MASIRHLITAFFAGEISPMLQGRVDTQHHAYGLETCENFVPMVEGPLVKRPGFLFVRDADATATWLSTFRFNITQEYVVEWGAAKARFFTNGGRVESPPGTPYEVVTPYAAADAPRLSFQQSKDRLYIDHGSYAPAALSRTSAVTFSHAASTFVDGPFLDQNSDKTLPITTSGTAVGASVTLTAAAPIWNAGHVGALWRIDAADFSTVTAWENGMDAITIGMQVRSDGKIYEALTAGKTGSVQPIHEDGAEWDGMNKNDVLNAKGPFGVKWKFVSLKFGTVKITAFTDSTHVTATVLKALPGSLTSIGSWRWAEGAFSTARGWPALVLHWKGRQIHFKDFTMFGSVAGDYLNHGAYTSNGTPEADLAFRRTIATDNPPLWVAADRAMLTGTADRELAIAPINGAQALSGANIEAEPQSAYGSDAVFPVQAGTQTVFVERGGRRIRATDFDIARDRYEPRDLTAAARHVTASGIIQMAYQRTPQGMVHMVRADGELVTHPWTRDDLKGFCRMVLGGGATILSAACVFGADGKTDDLWLLISRSTPAGTRREVWKQAAWRELGDAAEAAFFVDGGWTVTAAAGQTHFSGFPHLADQAVAVLCNGSVVRGLTVSNTGTLDLPADIVPDAPFTVTCGLPFTATAVTLRPEPASAKGTIQGLRQRVVKVVLRLLDTLGIKAGGVRADGSVDPLEELLDRPAAIALDAAPTLFSGDTVSTNIECEYDRNGQVRFVSDLPLPAVIPAAMLSIDVDSSDA